MDNNNCTPHIRSARINLTGQKFNKLTVLEYLGNRIWLCQCDCGNTVKVQGYDLKNSKQKSCGCYRKDGSHRTKDIVGKVFDRLTVVKYFENGKWMCECICGRVVEVYSDSLNSGNTRSCGCLQRELIKARSLKHGHTASKTSSEYRSWCGMKDRCTNPNNPGYLNYGGRGIKICAEWVNDFQAFFEHIGPKPSKLYSVDRIDNNRGYEPNNVHWATPTQQTRNTRHNKYLTFNGQTKIISDWEIELKTSKNLVGSRINRGWCIECALTLLPKRGSNQSTQTCTHKPSQK